ncbi:hypothetical protein V2P20_15375 [Methylobacter sp. Wu1]|uniref:hypothetical protein n=1 Tax=Methylobacter sp. Wu1 TaxID=3119359 RepID=UPI002F93F602
MNDYYDLEALKRFIEKVDKNYWGSFERFIECKASGIDPEPENLGEGITKEEFLAVARALSALIVVGVDLRKELGIRKKTGPKNARLKQTIHDPEFGIVLSLESGEITYDRAIDLLKREFHVEKTTAEKFIKDRREAVRNIIKIKSLIDRKTSKI